MLEPREGHDGYDRYDGYDEYDDHAEPPPIERFRRSAVGSVFAAGLLGLRDVFEPPKDEEPAIVEDWSGQPYQDDPYVLRLDPDHPEDSIVMVRPWLRHPPGTTG